MEYRQLAETSLNSSGDKTLIKNLIDERIEAFQWTNIGAIRATVMITRFLVAIIASTSFICLYTGLLILTLLLEILLIVIEALLFIPFCIIWLTFDKWLAWKLHSFFWKKTHLFEFIQSQPELVE